MENASKALLIAAAILIVILLITFGIKIFSSSSNSADNAASVVGKEIELATSDASDIIAGYTVKKYSNTVVDKPYNGYYVNYFTGIEINENTTYIISFDYIIEEKGEYDINCGIGMGINNPNEYGADFEYQKAYPSQEVGKKNTFTYTLKPNENQNYKINKEGNKIYLSLRPARTSEKSTFKVKIENIKIRYKVD